MFGINGPHLHLLVNHLPVVGSIAALVLLIWAMIRNKAELKRTALLSFVLVAVFAVITSITGGGAADIVKNIPGVDRDDIEEHIEASRYALVETEVLGVFAIFALLLASRRKDTPVAPTQELLVEYEKHHKEPPAWTITVALILSILSAVLFGWTANQGGEIRHTEIRSDYSPGVPKSL